MADRRKGSTRSNSGQGAAIRAIVLDWYVHECGHLSRWHVQGADKSDFQVAVESGDGFTVTADQMLFALSYAGQDNSAFHFEGPKFGYQFHIGEDNAVTEFTAQEVEVARREARANMPHCTGKRKDGTPQRCARCCPSDDWRADGILTYGSVR